MKSQTVKVRGILAQAVAELSAVTAALELGKEGLRASTREIVDAIIAGTDRVTRLAAAFRRFPMFDTSVVSRMIPKTLTFRRGGQKAEIEMVLPAFGYGRINNIGSTPQDIRYRFNEYGGPQIQDHFGYHLLNWTNEVIQNNLDALKSLGSVGQADIVTKCPAIPADVKRRVQDAADEFKFDSLAAVWEAEYTVSAPKDPLIIGRLSGYDFLVDQYDPSKMERYITAEFSTPPVEEPGEESEE